MPSTTVPEHPVRPASGKQLIRTATSVLSYNYHLPLPHRAFDKLGEAGPFSPPSQLLDPLAEGTQRMAQAPKLVAAEGQALSIVWAAVEGSAGYELQMAVVTVEGAPLEWVTVAAAVRGTSAKKKGDEPSELELKRATFTDYCSTVTGWQPSRHRPY